MKYLFFILVIGLFACEKKEKHQENTHKPQKDSTKVNTKPFWHDVASQEFVINADSTNIIVGENGVFFVFLPQCFTDSTEKIVQGKVQIQVKEAQKVLDSLQTNIQTDVQTLGVFYLEAFQDNKKLKIKDQESIWIGVPYTEKLKNIDFWKGSMIKNTIVWKNEASYQIKPIKMPNPSEKVLLEYGIAINEASLQKSHQETSHFLKQVDEKFVLKGNKYVYKPSAKEAYEEAWDVSFINKIRQKLKAIETSQKYLKEQTIFNKLKNEKIEQAWKNYPQNRVSTNPIFNEFPIEQMGWFAISKTMK
ncbi:hypothetical protein AD998_13325 [bacterium 336/3]|nr:hypothetical protein AD998_13325 [bacterium 336/3]